MTFLDGNIFDKDGTFKYKIHVRDTKNYLACSGCHAVYIKRSISKSLSIQAKNMCVEDRDYLNYINKPSNSLSSIGYSQNLIDWQINVQNQTTTSFGNVSKFDKQYFFSLCKANKILKLAHNMLFSLPLTHNFL